MMVSRWGDGTFNERSDGGGRLLEGMLDDDGASRLSDIAERMGVSGNYAAQYRRRLIERGVIGPRGRGKVAFELPGMRDFLSDQVVDF